MVPWSFDSSGRDLRRRSRPSRPKSETDNENVRNVARTACLARSRAKYLFPFGLSSFEPFYGDGALFPINAGNDCRVDTTWNKYEFSVVCRQFEQLSAKGNRSEGFARRTRESIELDSSIGLQRKTESKKRRMRFSPVSARCSCTPDHEL